MARAATATTVVVRLNAKWRIVECRQHIQWILQRRKSASDGGGWSARSFCRTSEALRRVAAEHAGAIDPEAQEALDRLPEWIEDVDQPVRHELVDELDHPREGPPSPTGARTRTPTRAPPTPGSPGPPSAPSGSRSTSPTPAPTRAPTRTPPAPGSKGRFTYGRRRSEGIRFRNYREFDRLANDIAEAAE